MLSLEEPKAARKKTVSIERRTNTQKNGNELNALKERARAHKDTEHTYTRQAKPEKQ